jgi:hypothetical protein
VVLATGLALLGASASVWTMSAAWLLLGIGIGRYDERNCLIQLSRGKYF